MGGWLVSYFSDVTKEPNPQPPGTNLASGMVEVLKLQGPADLKPVTLIHLATPLPVLLIAFAWILYGF